MILFVTEESECNKLRFTRVMVSVFREIYSPSSHGNRSMSSQNIVDFVGLADRASSWFLSGTWVFKQKHSSQHKRYITNIDTEHNNSNRVTKWEFLSGANLSWDDATPMSRPGPKWTEHSTNWMLSVGLQWREQLGLARADRNGIRQQPPGTKEAHGPRLHWILMEPMPTSTNCRNSRVTLEIIEHVLLRLSSFSLLT